MNGERFASLTEDQQRISATPRRPVSTMRSRPHVPRMPTRRVPLRARHDARGRYRREPRRPPQAVQPVYDEIASDPTNAAWLDEITALKDQIGAPPHTAECPATESTAPPQSADAEALEGTYQWTLTEADAAAAPDDFQLPWTGTMVLADGRFRGTNDRDDGEFVGTYEVFRDVLVLTEEVGLGEEVWSFTFEVNNAGDITATPAPGTDPLWTFIMGTRPVGAGGGRRPGGDGAT